MMKKSTDKTIQKSNTQFTNTSGKRASNFLIETSLKAGCDSECLEWCQKWLPSGLEKYCHNRCGC